MLGNRTGLVARRLCGAAIALVMLLSLLPVGGVLASPPAIPVLGAVATGTHHTCAVANDGSVWCWGTDQYGQLGDGLATPVTRLAAARVIGISRATAVAAGQQHTCALLSTGTAECWGRNDEHQLGDGTNQALSTTPVAVEGLHHAVALSARGDHTCALLDDATIKCWGD